MVDLAAIARRLPDVTEGVACCGTKLESRTFAVGKKTFLFVSATQARLKLHASVAEAKKFGVVVGANGWATLSLDALPPTAVLRPWIAESHALVEAPASKMTAVPKKRASTPKRR